MKLLTMAKRNFWTGMLAIMLVFGMTAIACDNGTTNGNSNGNRVFEGLDLTTTPPGADILDNLGLELSQYNRIIDAGGGNFLGWSVGEFGVVTFVWSNRNMTHFTAVANVLDDLFGQTFITVDFASGNGYEIYFSTGVASERPAGTLILWMGEMDEIILED